MTNENVSRRDFLKGSAALSIVGVSQMLLPRWLPRLAFRPQGAQVAARDTLICIFLRGGMDGISAVIPVGEGKHYYDARPSQAVLEPGGATNSAIDLDGFFALHPAMAPLKDVYDEGDLCIAHATGLTDATRSHFDAMLFMEYGTPSNKTIGTGWIGRHLQSAAWQNESPFRAVGIGSMLPGSLRGAEAPLCFQSIADFHLRGREDELQRMQTTLASLYSITTPQNLLDRQAAAVFETVDMLQQLDANHYQTANGAAYPQDPYGFGMGLQQIAQLVKADVGLEVACLDLGGWDTHENQGTLDGEFNTLLDIHSRGLAALHADLSANMQDVTVVTMSEFGRRVEENASQGTDHGHGNIMLLMGGGVNGGQVYSQWPSLAPEALDDGDLAITTDYRDVLAEVMQHRVLNPAIDTIFPDHTPRPLGLVAPRTA